MSLAPHRRGPEARAENERRVMHPGVRKRLFLVALSLLLLGQFHAFRAQTMLCWPFATVPVYLTTGEHHIEQPEFYVLTELGERPVVRANALTFREFAATTVHVRIGSEDFHKNAHLLARAIRQRNSTFQGFRIYRVEWDLDRAQRTSRTLVYEERWDEE